MPHYERTGMQSHRHPFYGYRGMGQDWQAVADEATAAAIMAVQASTPEAAVQQANAAAAAAGQPVASPTKSSGTTWIIIGMVGVIGLGLIMGARSQ